MNDFILLDSPCVCLGANVACSNDEKLEVNAREFMRNMVEDWSL